MSYLLDTHVFIWWLIEPDRVSTKAAAILGEGASLYLASVSIWETLVLARKRRLSLAPDPVTWVRAALRQSPVSVAPLDMEVAIRSEQLTGFRRKDPAARFVVATALVHGWDLVTADKAMRSYRQVKTIW